MTVKPEDQIQDTGNGNPPPKLPVQDPDEPTDSVDTGNGNPPPKNQA